MVAINLMVRKETSVILRVISLGAQNANSKVSNLIIHEAQPKNLIDV